MKSYTGKIVHVEGRGNILLTRIPSKEKLPKIHEVISVNGCTVTVRELETVRGARGRKEDIGIVLMNDK